jgi:hypothetical protein
MLTWCPAVQFSDGTEVYTIQHIVVMDLPWCSHGTLKVMSLTVAAAALLRGLTACLDSLLQTSFWMHCFWFLPHLHQLLWLIHQWPLWSVTCAAAVIRCPTLPRLSTAVLFSHCLLDDAAFQLMQLLLLGLQHLL